MFQLARLLGYFKTDFTRKLKEKVTSWRNEWVSELTNDSAVITIDGSRSGDVLLHDVETDDGSVGWG